MPLADEIDSHRPVEADHSGPTDQAVDQRGDVAIADERLRVPRYRVIVDPVDDPDRPIATPGTEHAGDAPCRQTPPRHSAPASHHLPQAAHNAGRPAQRSCCDSRAGQACGDPIQLARLHRGSGADDTDRVTGPNRPHERPPTFLTGDSLALAGPTVSAEMRKASFGVHHSPAKKAAVPHLQHRSSRQ